MPFGASTDRPRRLLILLTNGGVARGKLVGEKP